VRFLVDANVLSEPTRAEPSIKVVEWLSRHERQLVVDPIVVGELRFGILLLERGRRRQRLERWFEQGVARLVCLAWDAATGLRWAQLLADLRHRGQAMPVKDSMIAATALTHGLAVATRSRRDFAKARVEVIDPFA
jgi:predicted nucleic acid-binding protein